MTYNYIKIFPPVRSETVVMNKRDVVWCLDVMTCHRDRNGRTGTLGHPDKTHNIKQN